MKDKLDTSIDKLSLFGLMVKPVQRFPQFIMLIQVRRVGWCVVGWFVIDVCLNGWLVDVWMVGLWLMCVWMVGWLMCGWLVCDWCVVGQWLIEDIYQK